LPSVKIDLGPPGLNSNFISCDLPAISRNGGRNNIRKFRRNQVLLGLADWKNCEGGTLTVENRMKLHIPDQETWKKWKEDPLKKKGVICTDSTILQSPKLYKACRLLQKKCKETSVCLLIKVCCNDLSDKWKN
jgi:hypothetical protein